ncbi:pescadillo, partial [Tanacetum coccineum]
MKIAVLKQRALHEKFREMRSYKKKVKKAMSKKNTDLAERLLTRKPTYTLDMLICERYPRFIDTLRDLDDCLTMVHLFAALPAIERKIFNQSESITVEGTLSLEWQAYISRTHKLRKAFVSVKGIYYQAEVDSQKVTWLTPHALLQVMPQDVDYKIMLTFLEFYEVINLKYPPILDPRLKALAADLYALTRYVDAKDRTSGTNDEESELRLAQLEDQLPSNEPGFSSLGRSREVFQLTQVCGSRDAFPSLVVPLVHLSLPLVSLSFQPRTYNLSTLPFRDSVQIAENDLVVSHPWEIIVKIPANSKVCGSRDAFPSLVVPLVHLSLPLVSLSFQPRTYNLSTLPFRDSVQIAENDLVVKKFPENDLVVKKFPENDLSVDGPGEASIHIKATTTTGGSSNHQRQQQPPAAAATTGGNLAVNRSQPKSTAVNRSQPQSTKVNSGQPQFSGDARNVRLGLAADGFNPFGMMSQTYSMWPVILTTYNTPPWMCMKETSLMLTMLIPGPKSPAKDIDVYLQPLIKELQELWKGVWMKDAATGTHLYRPPSSHVTLSVGLTCLEHTYLSINAQSTEVDAPPVNDDNANANEGNAKDDDVAHVIDDDDDVVVSD